MDDSGEVPGSRDVADVLSSDPIAVVVGAAIAKSYALGLIMALLIVGMIVFGPSTDSRFIYTDF